MTPAPGSSPASVALEALSDIKPLYLLPADDLAGEVLIPCFRSADTADCMMGFFSSEALGALAPGLATFINQSSNSRLRLIVSPFLKPEDQAAIDEGLRSVDDLARDLLGQLIITEDELQLHTLRCLAHLVRASRIEFRVALLRGALFHPKVWLFHRHGSSLAAHGSSNLTVSGIKRNFEQITISRSWSSPTERYVVDKFQFQFQRLWEDKEEDCVVVPLPTALREELLRRHSDNAPPPSEQEFETLYKRALRVQRGLVRDAQSTPPPARPLGFALPADLKYREGPFAHQGEAVDAWSQAGFRGILEMATGAGKTITAMVGTFHLWQERRPLVVVIAAPYVPLIQQWQEELATFGIKPLNLTGAAGAQERSHLLQRVRRRVTLDHASIEAIVVSHDTLCTSEFQEAIRTMPTSRLLIADEVHNLGRDSFIRATPDFFEYRLGLSATPVRQYDDAGTKALAKFFGPIVFRFPLEAAIGRCLVEYDYFVHPVALTEHEMERWYELTEQIRQNAWRQEDGEPDEYLTKLFRDRRETLETAVGKIDALATALAHENLKELKHTLIYASDKGPAQLEAVNRLLRDNGVLFHQLTAEETADRSRTQRIIQSFREGEIQVITAKRVLDEGVNIPEISRAYILASTTVERQWIQRRGRLLRICPATQKRFSVIHDFLAVPPSGQRLDADARKVVQSELKRVQAFARLARNAGRPDGPASIIARLVDVAFVDVGSIDS